MILGFIIIFLFFSIWLYQQWCGFSCNCFGRAGISWDVYLYLKNGATDKLCPWSIFMTSGHDYYVTIQYKHPSVYSVVHAIYDFIEGLKKTFNTLRLRQNGRHFPNDIFKWIFFNENVWISINISLKFVPRGSINNIPTLVKVMAWRQPGDKPLSEPMMVRLPMHICVTRPQWVNVTTGNKITDNSQELVQLCWPIFLIPQLNKTHYSASVILVHLWTCTRSNVWRWLHVKLRV